MNIIFNIIEIGNHLHPCSNWKWLSTQTSQADNQSHGSQGAPGTQDIIQQKDDDDNIITNDNDNGDDMIIDENMDKKDASERDEDDNDDNP